MKMRNLLSIIACVIWACNTAQVNNGVKILDKKIAKHTALNKTYAYYTGDTLVTILKPNEWLNYILKKSYPGSSFKYIAVYDKETLRLLSEGRTFTDMPVGVYSVYDQDGTIVKTINYEEKFPLGVEDVILIVKNSLHINLHKDTQGLKISREISRAEDRPVYDIYLPQTKENLEIRHIKVDGTSGRILLNKMKFCNNNWHATFINYM